MKGKRNYESYSKNFCCNVIIKYSWVGGQSIFVNSHYFFVKYSKNKDMSDAKYFNYYGTSKKSYKCINKLKKNTTYYMQIAPYAAEASDFDFYEEWFDSLPWMGKRKVVIRK